MNTAARHPPPDLPSLSIVIPVHDEAENVVPLATEIETALAERLVWECLWVDDGSTDDTLDRLRALRAREPRHRVLHFDRRSGQSAALLAGFLASRHAFVGSLDGDGQNDPADLPRLLEIAVRDHLDMVNGVRKRRHDSWLRRVSSRIGNGFRNRVTGDRITDVGCSTRVFRRRYVAALPRFDGMHRFLPTFVRLAGARVGEAPVAHRPRRHGRPKYGVGNRLGRGMADTFGVRWLARRAVDPGRAQELAPDPHARGR